MVASHSFTSIHDMSVDGVFLGRVIEIYDLSDDMYVQIAESRSGRRLVFSKPPNNMTQSLWEMSTDFLADREFMDDSVKIDPIDHWRW